MQIEIPPGRPLLPVEELNRLIRHQGLGLAITQAYVLDEINAAMALEDSEAERLLRDRLNHLGVNPDDQGAIAAYLERHQLSLHDIRQFATKGRRLELFQQACFGGEAELRFLERKLDLDHVIYSMIRVRDKDLIDELHQQIREGEADFSDLAPRHSEGNERFHLGRIGPLPLSAAHPLLLDRLRSAQVGQLLPPFLLVDVWVMIRIESFLPAELDDAMRQRMIGELFELWFEERVRRITSGEPAGELPLHHLAS
ncbi:MAG: peptidylprolyl isomerase [Synechococcaceae cyanobacterium]|nr:peptidylprolyl isomerase [Synechococcaceae cyanobacterium]